MVSRRELRDLIDSINGRISDSTIRHQTQVFLYTNGQVRETLKLLEGLVFERIISLVDRRLNRIAARGFDVTPRTSKAIKNLLESIDKILKDGYSQSYASLAANLDAFSTLEARFAFATLGQNIPNDVFRMPDPGRIAQVVRSRPIHGRFLRDWFHNLENGTRQRINQELVIGISQGESADSLVRRIRGTAAARFSDGVFNVSREHARTVVRTASTHVSAFSREEVYRANADLIEGVRYKATLDLRTTLICANLDGKVFLIGVGPRPPQHPRCRSVTVPVLKPSNSYGLDAFNQGQRAALGGPVPASETFPAWFKRQSVAAQNQSIGAVRARLFRSGVPLEKFVDRHNQILTLDQLERIEGLDVGLSA